MPGTDKEKPIGISVYVEEEHARDEEVSALKEQMTAGAKAGTELKHRLLASAEIIEKPNSCEVSVNAKGDVSFKVKAYGATLEEAVVEAVAEAAHLKLVFIEKKGASS